ncbi:MAG: hypothetical protein AAFY29_11445 [Pseudomonadota bacterium]
MNDVLSYEALKVRANARQEKALIRWLKKNRIRWMRDAKGKPITTIAANEKVMNAESDEEVDF